MNGVQTRFKCKLDVKRCKRFVFPPSSLLPRSNALKTKAIRYFQTDRTLTRIVSPPLRTIVLSDIHLGTSHSKVEQVCNFLSQANCERLILNGDIIDGWSLQKFGAGKWKPQHTRFFKIIMKMMENYGTEVIYIRGNHDDFIDSLAPLKFANLSIVKEYMLESNGRHYFITHGDVFDKVTTQMKWLAKLGDIGYTLLLWLNSQYNRWRIKQGKPYYSLSQEIKQKVKSAVSYISDFEKVLAEFARNRQCEGVICGHIHHPENKMIDNVHYLNSGDWVETMSALTEDEEGNWDILYYSADMDKENTNNENMVLTLIPAAS